MKSFTQYLTENDDGQFAGTAMLIVDTVVGLLVGAVAYISFSFWAWPPILYFFNSYMVPNGWVTKNIYFGFQIIQILWSIMAGVIVITAFNVMLVRSQVLKQVQG